MLESINQVERVELLCEWSIDGWQKTALGQ